RRSRWTPGHLPHAGHRPAAGPRGADEAGAAGSRRGRRRSEPGQRRAGTARRGTDRDPLRGRDQAVDGPPLRTESTLCNEPHDPWEAPVRSVNRARGLAVAGAALALALAVPPASSQQGARSVETVSGMPPVVDPSNLYSETRSDKLSPAAANALPRVYVPNLRSNDVWVIDPATRKVIDRFRVGVNPQHVVPSYDLKTLWVTNNAEGRTDGSLTPIDPTTGKPGKAIAV